MAKGGRWIEKLCSFSSLVCDLFQAPAYNPHPKQLSISEAVSAAATFNSSGINQKHRLLAVFERFTLAFVGD